MRDLLFAVSNSTWVKSCKILILIVPDWMGLREPVSMEASILSMAESLSGLGELIGRLAPEDEGFGGYQKHLGGRPFVVRGD